MKVLDRLYAAGIVPVVVLDRLEDAIPTARSLLAGGIDVMEITLRTPCALEAIALIRQSCSEILVGAGTVCTEDQGNSCVSAGAQFIVSPGMSINLVKLCMKNSLPIIPGCVTPTEIMRGMEVGLRVFKFFPANVYGGLQAMKSLAGPFPDIRFLPTGGINAFNLAEYAAVPFIHAVGGSWLCSRADITAGNFQHITALASEAQQSFVRK